MKKISNDKFESYRNLLIARLPAHSEEFLTIDLYYDENGGDWGNGEILLIDSLAPSTPIASSASSSGISESNIDRYAQDFCRVRFVECAAKAINHYHVMGYFVELLSAAYNDVRTKEYDDRIEIAYSSFDFMPRSGVFTVNLIPNKLVVYKDHATYKESFFTSSYNTYYSKFSEENVINHQGIVGILSLEPAFSHSSNLYAKAFDIPVVTAVEIIEALSPAEKSLAYALKKKLIDLPLSLGLPFEKVLKEILFYLFSSCYESLEMFEQIPNQGRLRIRDIIIDNLAPKNKFLAHLSSRGANYLLMDAKNYKDSLATSDIDTFINYIRENKHFGNFGIILSRKGSSDNLQEQLIRRSADGIEVVILDEPDILRMIDLRALNRDPMTVINERLRELRLQA